LPSSDHGDITRATTTTGTSKDHDRHHGARLHGTCRGDQASRAGQPREARAMPAREISAGTRPNSATTGTVFNAEKTVVEATPTGEEKDHRQTMA
jgi:hypothetical protein